MSRHSVNKGGPFTIVGGLSPKRHFFNLSHSKLMDCDFGKLYPIVHEELLPHDKVKIGNNIVIRSQPLFAPILQNIKVYVEYFFVPTRLLWSDWQTFITGGDDGEFSGQPPLWNGLTAASITFSVGQLADYCGLPVGVAIPKEDAPNGFVQIAYNRIFNEYYRDENIDVEVLETNNSLLYRRRKKDYFTSALPFQQRGSAPAFAWDVGGSADVLATNLAHATVRYDLPDVFNGKVYSYQDLSNGYSLRNVDYTKDGDPQNIWEDFGVKVGSHNSSVNETQVALAYNTSKNQPVEEGVFASPSSGTGTRYMKRGFYANFKDQTKIGTASFPNATVGFNVSELRTLVQIQKFLERNARAGVSRLNEFLLAHFGVAPQDSVLQRPEYIGGLRGDVVASEVLQTSESGTSPQGNLAGRGVGILSDYVGTYTASEHGYLIGLLSIMPVELYDSQGIGKEWTRRNRYDYYFPEFAHLSEQPILNRELYVTADHSKIEDDVEVGNIGTFGFSGIYNEYRHKRSMVTGLFRVGQGFERWTLARSFTETPKLNSIFLKADYASEAYRVFAVNSVSPFFVHCGNSLKMIRPIPVLAEPGFVDHF